MKKLPASIIALLLAFPLLASAATTAPEQPSDELKASIQSALMSDPATDAMPPEELDKLVEALAAEATKNGVAPADITYVPRPPADSQSAGAGGDLPANCDVWCVFAHAYGFDGVDPTTPILLLISSGLLVMIFRRALHPQHIEHFTGVKPAASTAPKPAGPVSMPTPSMPSPTVPPATPVAQPQSDPHPYV